LILFDLSRANVTLTYEFDDYISVDTEGQTAGTIEKVEREIKRLEQMPPLSSEAAVSRHYIEWLTALPWKKTSTDSISLEEAETILNNNHAGLKKAKERYRDLLYCGYRAS